MNRLSSAKQANQPPLLAADKEVLSPRTLGGNWEGKATIADNFDAPDNKLINSLYHKSTRTDLP